MLEWFHEDPEYVIQKTVQVHGSESVMNIIGVGATCCEFLKQQYEIETINQLESHISEYGFPQFLDNRAKFMLSIRMGIKVCVKRPWGFQDRGW
tara:strand:+ start:154 stop:435 length:282 start_codon:yes stop_codon:yes gene_type:complete